MNDLEKLEYIHSTLKEFWSGSFNWSTYADRIDNSLIIIEELKEKIKE